MESKLHQALRQKVELEQLLEAQDAALRELRDECQYLREAESEAKGNTSLKTSFHLTETLADQLLVDAREEIAVLKAQLEKELTEKQQLEAELLASSNDAQKLKEGLEVVQMDLRRYVENTKKLEQDSHEREQISVMKINEMKLNFDTLNEEKNNLEINLRKMTKNIASLTEERDAMVVDLDQIREALLLTKAERASLQSVLIASTEQIELRINELASVAVKMEAAEKARTESTQLIDQLTCDVKMREESIVDLERTLQETKTFVENLNADKAQSEVKIKEMLETEQRLRKAIDELKGQVTEQATVISNLESGLEKAKHSYEVSISEMTEEKSKLCEALLQKTASITLLEATIKKTQLEHGKELTSIIAERDNLCQELTEVNQQVVEKDWAYSKMELERNAKVTDLEEIKDQINKEIKEVTTEYNTLKDQLEQSRSDSVQHLQIISQMSSEVNNLKEKYSQTTLDLQSQIALLRDQATVIDKLEESINELIDENSSFKHSEVDFKMVSMTLQEKIQKAIEERKNLLSVQARCQSELKESKKGKAKSDGELETCRADSVIKQQLIANCEERVFQLQVNLKNMEKTLEEAEKENDELSAKLKDCQKQLDEKGTEISQFTQEIIGLKIVIEKKSQLLAEKESFLCERDSSLAALIEEAEKSALELLRVKKERDEEIAEKRAIEGMKETSDITIVNLKEQLKHLGAENEELNFRLKETCTVLLKRDEDIAILEHEKKQDQSTLQEIKISYDTLCAEKDQLKVDLKESQHLLEMNLAEISKNAEEMRALKDCIDEMKAELEEKEIVLVESGEAVTCLKEELRVAHEESKKIKVHLEEQLLSAQSNCEKLNEKLKELQIKVIEKEKAVETSEEELKTLRNDLRNERTYLKDLKEKMRLEKETLEKNLLAKDEGLQALQTEFYDIAENKTQLEEKLSILIEENNNLSFEVDRMRKEIVESKAETRALRSELEQAKLNLEQQAVEFNREKMQITTELELQQRNSATALRHLEAKNLALDEVKNVAMAKVHELLKSHGQLRQELEDLVANKSAENTTLGMQVCICI